ncbi:hypothetical protein ACFPH8_14965 [Bizionia hallyeonensis]|uniref:Four helix bundle protein n=1 Tax=Bizionia hallyeonensis TaxID=1123757 RepID=A0ABW0C8T9_9FLAO
MTVLSEYPNRVKSDQDDFLNFCNKVLKEEKLNSSEKIKLIDIRLEDIKKEIDKVTRLYF